jgi:iron(III) transport system substrate-binding protein
MKKRSRWWVAGTIIVLAVGLLLINRTSVKEEIVVVYVSEDQVFSEPILKDFEKETGIIVKPVFDTEEAKSTGAMNRPPWPFGVREDHGASNAGRVHPSRQREDQD